MVYINIEATLLLEHQKIITYHLKKELKVTYGTFKNSIQNYFINVVRYFILVSLLFIGAKVCKVGHFPHILDFFKMN